MKRCLKRVGYLMISFFFGVTCLAVSADQGGMPKRVRTEMEARQEREKAEKEARMTPEEKVRQEEAVARRRAFFKRRLVDPIAKLKKISFQRPSRRHDMTPETREEAAARRRAVWNQRLGKLLPGMPHRSGADSTPGQMVK